MAVPAPNHGNLVATSILHPPGPTPNGGQGLLAPGVTNLSTGAYTNPTGVTYQTVDPNALVGNQINGLLQQDGTYIQNAQAQGVQYGASRGLLNSAMTGGASENAAIGAALPIATANAQEIAGVNAANQQAANQYTGENIAANAQISAAGAMAAAQVSSAMIQAQQRADEAKQQFQEYGMGLGLSYAQLSENDKQFNMQFGQHGQEFQQQLDQQNQQFEQGLAQSMAQFTQSKDMQIGEFQAGMDWNRYSLGVQVNASNSHDYSSMFQSIMMNPNMTAQDRQAALGNAKDFYSQMSQWTAAGAAFVPPYASDSNYWSRDWTGGTSP